MRVDTLRFLDRFVGVPICWAFTVARQVSRTLGRSRTLPAPRRILIIKLSEMGSTVLAYPALAELKRRCPEAELFFLVFSSNAPIVDVLDLMPAENVITVDPGSTLRMLKSGFRAMRTLLSKQIDTTIDMDFFSRFAALISFVVCRGNRVGFHRYTEEGRYRGNLLTHRVLYSPHVHTSAAFLALTRTLFEDPRDEPHYRGRIDPRELTLPDYSPTPADIQGIGRTLEASGVRDFANEPLILINPNSSDVFPLRAWPLDNFSELCRRLLSAVPQCWLIITGVKSERKDARYITERMRNPRCLDFTGKTSCRELLALYSLATVMVTNDSGPAHMASLLRLPTIVLFGPETPRLYGPLGDHHRDLYAGFACSPCVSVYNGKKSPCQDSRCLKSITVDDVLAEVLNQLPRPSGRFRLRLEPNRAPGRSELQR